MRTDIVLFGIQWSGKWTQANLLIKALKDYQYFEPGNILRALKSNDNVLWAHVRIAMDEGKMVDDEIIFGMFDIYQHLLKPGECMLVDGFMRSLPQMHYFLYQEYMHKRNLVGIHFDLSKEQAVERLTERAKKEWRSDDNEKAIEKRIFVYETETIPVIDHLNKMGKLIRIDANQPVQKIFEDTIQAVKNLDMLE